MSRVEAVVASLALIFVCCGCGNAGASATVDELIAASDARDCHRAQAVMTESYGRTIDCGHFADQGIGLDGYKVRSIESSADARTVRLRKPDAKDIFVRMRIQPNGEWLVEDIYYMI